MDQTDVQGKSSRGDQRGSNPCCESHNLACYHYTMTTIRVPSRGLVWSGRALVEEGIIVLVFVGRGGVEPLATRPPVYSRLELPLLRTHPVERETFWR